jgi:hypothetical protein
LTNLCDRALRLPGSMQGTENRSQAVHGPGSPEQRILRRRHRSQAVDTAGLRVAEARVSEARRFGGRMVFDVKSWL